MNERTRLERIALDAHRRGLSWSEYWPTVALDVAQAEPHDRAAYRRLVRRLSHLLTCGDLDGATPISTGTLWGEPWEQDDAQGVAG